MGRGAAKEGSWLCHLELSQVGASWNTTQSCSCGQGVGTYPFFPRATTERCSGNACPHTILAGPLWIRHPA